MNEYSYDHTQLITPSYYLKPDHELYGKPEVD